MPRKKACDSCHSKKIHCDGGDPRCEWCAYRNIPCTYSRPARKKARTGEYEKGDDSQEELQDQIAQRINRLEGLLGGKVSNGAPQVSHYTQPANQDYFYGSLYFAGYNLGEITSQAGIPIFSQDGLRWIQERTGESRMFQDVYVRNRESSSSSRIGEKRELEDSEMPSMGLALTCYHVFCQSPLSRVFPMIDVNIFEGTIRRAYKVDGGNNNPQSVLGARACVLAFMAMAPLLEPIKLLISYDDSEMFAVEAQKCLLQVVDNSALDGVQAAICLCAYNDFLGNIQSASTLLSIAVRCVYRLGGHIGAKGPRNLPTHKSIRGFFWLCYFFDKHIALRTGQPSCINDAECDLNLHDYHGLAAQAQLDQYIYPSDLRLDVIKSKIASMLYSPASIHKSDSELLRDVRILDDELESWRSSMPEDVRPRLAVGDASNAPEILQRQTFGMVCIFIHLEYLYSISAIHRVCGRCTAWTDDAVGAAAVNSSLDLSLQASRSTLIYFAAATKYIHREAFWMIVFYPLWATLTIFCNILHNPRHDMVASDIQMLGSIPRIINQMHKRPLNPNESCHLEMLDYFVSELVRLARLAVNIQSPQSSTNMTIDSMEGH